MLEDTMPALNEAAACMQVGISQHWVIDSPGICRSDTSQATGTAHHEGMSSRRLKGGGS